MLTGPGQGQWGPLSSAHRGPLRPSFYLGCERTPCILPPKGDGGGSRAGKAWAPHEVRGSGPSAELGIPAGKVGLSPPSMVTLEGCQRPSAHSGLWNPPESEVRGHLFIYVMFRAQDARRTRVSEAQHTGLHVSSARPSAGQWLCPQWGLQGPHHGLQQITGPPRTGQRCRWWTRSPRALQPPHPWGHGHCFGISVSQAGGQGLGGERGLGSESLGPRGWRLWVHCGPATMGTGVRGLHT